MYKKAAQLKLRFDTSKGQLTTEDLFDLPLSSTTGRVNLNDIAKALHKRLKDAADVDFVDTVKRSDTLDQLKFDIVRDVIAVRVTERDAAALAAANKERKQNIMAIIEQKKGEALSAKSLEELEAELKAL
jgi:hypothetical protein